MQFQVRHRPSYAMVEVTVAPGERLIAEGGALVAKDAHVAMETGARSKPDQGLLGGLLAGAKRLLAGESFFTNRFTTDRPGRVMLAPALPGDLSLHTVDGAELFVQSSGFLCSEESVSVDASWGGARSFFAGEGLILLKASGRGTIVFHAFGGMRPVDVDGSFVVDTGHIVAFESTLSYSVGRFGGGWLSAILGSEGLVATFTGRGRLWVQSRSPQEFGQLVGPLLPPRE